MSGDKSNQNGKGRFQVLSINGLIDDSTKNKSLPSPKSDQLKNDLKQSKNDENDKKENVPLCIKQTDNLALYEDDYNTNGQKIGQMVRSISLYKSVLPKSEDSESACTNHLQKSKKKTPQFKMGTFMGVYLPCLQNIFGVLFFIRLPWIVGTAGIIESLLIVLLCCSVTFLTSISLSAIATNGVVSGGGPYYMISRNLGPVLGGAVGILFYLGTSIAASMYITGAVEIVILYIFPSAQIFKSIYNCYRVFGSVLLIFVSIIVLAGVKIVNRFALPGIIIVIMCFVCFFAGIFLKVNGSDSLKFCISGNYLVDLVSFVKNNSDLPYDCTASGLESVLCKKNSDSELICDPYFKSLNNSSIHYQSAFPGFSTNVFYENLWSKYGYNGDLLKKENVKTDSVPDKDNYWVFIETTTSFMVLVGVFFPSVTGIMAGSNRSGDLADASKSIPLGTIAAQLTSSIVYVVGTVLIGFSVSNVFLRDKLGKSALGKLVISEMAIPYPVIISIGCCVATIGAGMQSLTGAPRLLQAISADEVIPFLKPFKKTDSRGEPIRAIFFTILICEIGILIGVIENIAALITQFFLMCYLGVNTACALQGIMKAPSWRPSFKYFHWSLSTIGAFLCIFVMFISAWYFALVAIFIGAAVYKYIEYSGAEKEWGDGFKGLALSAARFALLNVDSRGEHHTRNWRPQLLVLYPESTVSSTKSLSSISDSINKDSDVEKENFEQAYKNIDETRQGLLSFVSQLKAGKGLTLLAKCIVGNFQTDAEIIPIHKQFLCEELKKYKIHGFSEVLIAEQYIQGISSLIQTSGLGGLRHNSVVIAFPDKWSQLKDSLTEANKFVNTIQNIIANKCAILMPKNVHNFPKSSQRLIGTIDVYWVVHDGGLLMLLPFLLNQHKTWKNTCIRLFTIAQPDDDRLQMKRDLDRFLYQLRIKASVNVIEMQSSDIDEYTYERTLKIEERLKLLKEINESKTTKSTIDEVVLDRKYSLARRQSILSKTENVKIQIENSDSNDEKIKEKNVNSNLNKVHFNESSNLNEKNVKDNHKNTVNKFSSDTYNLRKMHTALKLNKYMREFSSDAQLVIVNLPAPPKFGNNSYYMEFIEAISEGLTKILFVRGTGAEVVTIYS